MSRASAEDREYFARVARQSRAIADEQPPASLAEMLDRLEAIRKAHGELARPGVEAEGDGDLPSHLALLEHMKAVSRDGAGRP